MSAEHVQCMMYPNPQHNDAIIPTSTAAATSAFMRPNEDYTAAQAPTVVRQPSLPSAPPPIPRTITTRLYISHFLSTWNSRLFEYAAVLFLASIYPNTLMRMSIYALVRSGSAILFSPTVGRWIDKGNRLSVVRASIVWQRLAVAASCGIFWVLEWRVKSVRGGRGNDGMFAALVLLACVEKMASVMNLVSVERDWVVVIAGDRHAELQVLNARIRRIDLFCKLFGPLAISFVNDASVIAAVWATLGMNLASIVVEYLCIAKVYKFVPELQRPSRDHGTEQSLPALQPNRYRRNNRSLTTIMSQYLLGAVNLILPLKSLPFYFSHPTFLPSISLSLLYLTVLSFSGSFITFLLSSKVTSTHVGIARAVSTVFGLSATWIAPRIMGRIGKVRGGVWFLWWQMLSLAGGVAWFFSWNSNMGKAWGLVAGVIVSRVGLWGFDLCVQGIVQEEVDEAHRGSFSTVETSFANLFELLSYVTTIIWARPDQFK
ncbi:hypothetical protein BJ508DRAFT_89814 [Ascobolus immersus RN42]|uniref:Solute carrier family 40 member n=1 Tax=Ascobolus immersus RN42 TaxID=1160509 RepID=A0A3N4HAF6_ASCIM|nr:hypothetical protein BJ508DRAFT_89814 [Ascobolus immersus RN42]